MIRSMRVGEAETVARMSRALAAHHGDTGTLDARNLARLVAQGWLQVLVAEDGGTLVGYATLVRRVKTHEGVRGLHIDNLFVEERVRGQGIGRALLRAAAELGRAQGCAAVTVGTASSNEVAAQVYLGFGFEERTPNTRAFALQL